MSSPKKLFDTHQKIARIIAMQVAREFKKMNQFEDILQEGLIGLWKASEKFDSSRDFAFKTYASHVIKGHCLDYIREESDLVKKPAKDYFKTKFQVNDTDDDFREKAIYKESSFLKIEQQQRIEKRMLYFTEDEKLFVYNSIVLEEQEFKIRDKLHWTYDTFQKIKSSVNHKLGKGDKPVSAVKANVKAIVGKSGEYEEMHFASRSHLAYFLKVSIITVKEIIKESRPVNGYVFSYK